MPDQTVKELTEKLETGVKELFESDKYAEYLKTISRFHSYSTRNTLLIHLQDPAAHRVAGYASWKKNFNRQVKKGEHGIKIFAPIANKGKDIEVEKLDPVTKLPILDENGQPVMERLSPASNLQIRFKLVTVFSEHQTEGDPLPELAETLTGDVERYELFMDALRAVSPLPIFMEDLPPDTDGTCFFGEKIAIRSGMSEIQTVSAVIHEITHAKLHDKNLLPENDENIKDNRTSEIEAESVSYVVNQHFGIETGANSFGYIAAWGRSKEMKELNASLDTIRKTSASLIDAIDEKYRDLAKERGIDLTIPAKSLSIPGPDIEPAITAGEIKSSQKEEMTAVEKTGKSFENKLYDKFAELFPDFISGKFSYLKLESPGMEPLSLEWTGRETISVMHTYTMNGDLMYDPMITFWADLSEGDEILRAESFEQSLPPLYQVRGDRGEWQSIDGSGNCKFLYLDHNVGKFAGQWFKNIAEQGYMPVLGTLVRGEDDEVRVLFDKNGKMIEPEPETGNINYDEAAWHDHNDIEDGDFLEAKRTEINEIFIDDKNEITEMPIAQEKSEKQTALDISLPDPSCTIAEMNRFGYTSPDMYPLSIGRAAELFDGGHTIYMLYDDNTEIMVFDRDDIMDFPDDCYLGITKADWDMPGVRDAENKVQENAGLNSGQTENSKEANLIHSDKNMFGIYQIRRDIDEARDFRFIPFSELEALGLPADRANYELVYSAELTERYLHGMSDDNNKTLERLYEKFNINHPHDFTGHSLSVSDVVVLQQGSEVTAHYVDSVGFKELNSFTGNEREQTLSQIDTRQPAKQLEPKKPANKGVPTLMDEINEAKLLADRKNQPAAKPNEREVMT